MKKIVFLSLLLGLCIHQGVFAEDKLQNQKKWVGLMWKDGEKPIVVPVLSNTEKECIQLVNEMNDITKKTVKIDRHVSCQSVITK